jgi:hypothetical protein
MLTIKTSSIILSVLILFSTTGLAADKEKEKDVIVFNNDFYRKVIKKQLIMRDHFLDMNLDNTVSGIGIIESVHENESYGRNILIIVNDEEARKQRLEIVYHLYAGKNLDPNRFIIGGIIEFRGKFILQTPLNSGRNRYIFDIILDGDSFTIK